MQKLELVRAKKPDSPQYEFYKSLILLDQGKYDEAETGFTNLIEVGGTYKWHALWYSAFVNIEEGDFQTAIDQLKKMQEAPSGSLRNKSRSLRRSLAKTT